MSEATLNESIEEKVALPLPSSNAMTISVMNMTEKEYRAYPAVSYSRLSDIEKVGILAVNANVASIGKLRGVVLGSIVDDVISNKLNEMPDYIVTVDKIPGSGTITEKAIESIVDTFDFVDFTELDKDDLEHHLGVNRFMLNGMNSSNYYAKLLNYKEFINASKAVNEDTQIITKFDFSIAKKAIKRLRSLPLFHYGFIDDSVSTLIYQMKLLAKVNGIEIKCMLDAIEIDHDRKVITPIDIKTGAMGKSDFASFFYQAYLKYNYYIQAGLYRKILLEYFKNHPIYYDYEVGNFMFIYSTTNPKTSLLEENLFIHTIDQKMYLDSFKGFAYEENGKPGIKVGIGELLKFYKDNKIELPIGA
jgi:hypothetical protein